MTKFSGTWSPEEVESFLREVTIPIRIAVHRPDESLWMVTLWYRYRDGSFECATWANADVVRYLRNDSEISFDVSTNEPPYRGVRGNGVASLSPDRGKQVLESLIVRYLGDTDSSLATWLLEDEREEVRIRIQPEVVYSWDYSDRMS
ncbi:pyridoxamine 5'-phosphate oxidase family protein [Haloarculaceae archaeon H-GB2-1]|nr:pyridoxamine 5'-phosphate oxidase family protein [Haloarculaceae archaeon H-GB1-1]MEA5408252.1 pyridoxamine 5'-phosphate oxidase family protein [Haloarculaceae archaeon H-GB2-1]